MRNKLIGAIMAVLLMPSYAEARCFLFFCPATHHKSSTAPREQAPREQTTTPFCRGVTKAFAKSTVTAENFARSFPAAKQDQVLKCLPSDSN